MGLNCGAKFAKIVLFIFNIIFFLGGAAILGVGIWIVVDTGSYMDFLNKVDTSGTAADTAGNILTNNLDYVKAVGYVLIGVGSFIFLVGFLGCCGAIKQWRPLLVAYAILLMILMAIQIGVAIYVGAYRGEAVEAVKKDLLEWIKNYGYIQASLTTTGNLKPEQTKGFMTNLTATTNGWNAMQVYLQCCGVTNYRDFQNAPFYRDHAIDKFRDVPSFCCKMDEPVELHLADPKCFDKPTPANSNMDTGCVAKVEAYLASPAVIGVAVGIGLIELVGIIFSFCLCCAIGDKGRRYN